MDAEYPQLLVLCLRPVVGMPRKNLYCFKRIVPRTYCYSSKDLLDGFLVYLGGGAVKLPSLAYPAVLVC